MTGDELLHELDRIIDVGIVNAKHDTDVLKDIRNVLKELESEEEYPVCMACGQRIDSVKVLMFDHDGADHWYMAPIHYDKPTGGVSIRISRAWTSYDDYSESYMESIRCPLCDKHPFDKEAGCEIYQPVEVIMWTKGYAKADGQRKETKLE